MFNLYFAEDSLMFTSIFHLYGVEYDRLAIIARI